MSMIARKGLSSHKLLLLPGKTWQNELQGRVLGGCCCVSLEAIVWLGSGSGGASGGEQ